jgi:hypothetical protein
MKAVIAGHGAPEDAREPAYDPAIHPSCEKMDARVKPAHDWSDQSPHLNAKCVFVG